MQIAVVVGEESRIHAHLDGIAFRVEHRHRIGAVVVVGDDRLYEIGMQICEAREHSHRAAIAHSVLVDIRGAGTPARRGIEHDTTAEIIILEIVERGGIDRGIGQLLQVLRGGSSQMGEVAAHRIRRIVSVARREVHQIVDVQHLVF